MTDVKADDVRTVVREHYGNVARDRRAQRGRAQLRQMFEQCCEIALDARGKVTDFTPRPRPCHPCK